MIMGKEPLFSKTKSDTKMTRRNPSDKLRLIQMVHDNPILWDSRLPNFKGAEEEKSHAWQMIGNEFNVPGRRVARAFKSLRESYRRELTHVKMMGANFQPKWSLFMPMDFLRDVIRERKNGSAHNNLGGCGNDATPTNARNESNPKSMKCHDDNSNHSTALNIPDDYTYFVKPKTQQQQQQQQPPDSQHLADSRTTSMNTVTSTHNDSGGAGAGAKNASVFDDAELSSLRSDGTWNRNMPSHNESSNDVEELEAIDADFPYPLILENPNSPMPPPLKRRRKAANNNSNNNNNNNSEITCEEYEGQIMHQHRHLQKYPQYHRSQNVIMQPPEVTKQTIREVLNSKFCGFISAKLNSMEDAEADNLMNKILMLLVHTQASPMPIQTQSELLSQVNGQVNGCGLEVKEK